MKLRAWWQGVRDSLWFVPGLVTLLGVVIAPVMANIDAHFITSTSIREYWWLLGGSPAGARGVLTAIAGSLITVAGVVFSITIVALQLASTQFTPRVLQNFMSDRGVQLVLGVFIGTFAYTLLILRTVYSPIDDGVDAFVPAASVTLALVLALVSMGFLIYYINHVAGWIEASTIVDRVTRDTLEMVEKYLPFNGSEERPALEFPEEVPGRVLALRGGYVQMIEPEALCKAAARVGSLIRVEAGVGDFLLPSQTLATVWPRDCVDDDMADAVRAAFAIGHRRTITQDIELGLIQLSDIAVKALSPGINDPTTAMMSLDRIGQVVAEIGSRSPRPDVLRPEQGEGAAVLPSIRFRRVADIAFAQIRRYGARDAALLIHLLHVLAAVAPSVGPHERDILRMHVDDTEADARAQIDNEADRERVGAAAAAARRALGAVDRRE